MVNARYFTNVGEFIIKSLCFYWDFQYSWEYQSVYEFYGFGYAPNSVYRFQFLFVATYIEIPFMIMPIFNALEEMNPSLISASRDLGASSAETFRRVIFLSPKRCEKWRSSCLYSFALALYVNAFNWRQSGDYVGNGD